MLNSKSRKHLGDILIEAKIITSSQLGQALATPRLNNERIGDVLIRLGLVTEEQIISTLSLQLKIPAVKLDYYPIKHNVISLIPEHLAKRYCLIPIDLNNGKLIVAMSDPLDLTALDDLRMFTGYDVLPAVSSAKEIEEATARYYDLSKSLYKASQQIVSAKKEQEEIRQEIAATRIAAENEQAPAVRLVDLAIRQAVEQRASDIHFEPQEEGLKVRYRVDGILRDTVSLPAEIAPAVISRIKIMAGMDIAEKRLPQDGRISADFGRKKIDLRVSALPTIWGEKIVLRILDKSRGIIKIQDLGLSEPNLKLFKRMLKSPYGMILVTGPTGSGKTTTLYSGLELINNPEKNIITVEDPVEYTVQGINQVQVNIKAGLGFTNGLRAILRQDPDIIMVGEIRDWETADIAIRAAMTGHLVLSTLHTNDAASTITRLIDMGIEPFLISTALTGVISQRLVRVVCDNCKTLYPAEEDKYLPFFLPPEFYQGKMLAKGSGCTHCRGTGYKGRIGVYEVLEVNEKIRDLIGSKPGSEQIRKTINAAGIVSMFKDGVGKVFAGITTFDEIIRLTIADEGGKIDGNK